MPENAFTECIAPLPAVLALYALTGLYLRVRDTAGRLGLVGRLRAVEGAAAVQS